MVSSRLRVVLFLVFLFLAGISLRPGTDLPRQIETACEPVQALRALSSPIGWVSAGEVRAAERNLLAGEEERRSAARAVLALAQNSAAPSERSLSEGKGILHAEVVDVFEKEPDRLIVHFAPGSGVRRGMPVVCGDYFVGRVVAVEDVDAGLARVDLVTRKDFRVGAEVLHAHLATAAEGKAPAAPPESPLLVVGGVLPRSDKHADILLQAHGASDPSIEEGEVRVHEVGSRRDDPYRALADGFLIGWLERVGESSGVLGVRPGLDLLAGFSHVGILCPSEHTPAGLALARDPFDDEHWLPARFGIAGTASYWRETRVLTKGRTSGVSDGAAVVFGASLLGCVRRADLGTSSVQLLGDPGLEIRAMATWSRDPGGGETGVREPEAAILPVGVLVSLGRNRFDGTLSLRWDPSVRTGGDGAGGGAANAPRTDREVILYTASGTRSVPPGLRIGTTLLPSGRGPFVLRVRQEESGRSLTDVSVWRDVVQPTGGPLVGGISGDTGVPAASRVAGDRRP